MDQPSGFLLLQHPSDPAGVSLASLQKNMLMILKHAWSASRALVFLEDVLEAEETSKKFACKCITYKKITS